MIEKIFIDPDAPFCEKSADWLIASHPEVLESFPSNFGGLLLVVPTSFAAENLRESLARKLAEKGRYAFSGIYIETRETIFTRLASQETSIDNTEAHAIWLKILGLQKSRSALFPNGLPSRFERFESAAKFLNLQNALNENLLTFADALERLSNSSKKNECEKSFSEFEISRWRELSQMEEMFFKMAESGNPNILKSAVRALENGNFEALERGGAVLKKIVLMGNFDASGAFISFLKAAEKHVQKINVLVFARESEKDFFDEFGRPLVSYGKKSLEIDRKNVSVFFDTVSQAAAAAKVFESYGKDACEIVSLACNQEFKNLETVKSAFAEISKSAYLPEIESLKKTSFWDFIFKIRAHLKNKSFASFRELVFSPYVFFYLEEILDVSQNDLFSAFDSVASKFAPLTVDNLVEVLSKGFYDSDKNISNLKKVLALFEEKFSTVFFEEHSNSAGARGFAEILFETVKFFADAFFEGDGKDKVFEKAAFSSFKESLKKIGEIQKKLEYPFLPDEIFSSLLSEMKSHRKSGMALKGDVPLLNWVEIFWSQAPHILICDFNDGIVPMEFEKDEFLNDAIRNALGLRTREMRRARDAYMLEALWRSRLSEGRECSIFLPLNSKEGDPLNPSRLLFQIEDSELPARVKQLFSEPKDEFSRPSYSASWNLIAPRAPIPQKFSPSALNKYLESPWEYYLQNLLKAKIFDEQKAELDFSQIGDVFHEVMASFSKSNVVHSANADEIRAFLLKTFEKICALKFGEFPRVQIRLQLEALRQRFVAAATVQASCAADGWKIMPDFCEVQFEIEILGNKIAGAIDRVDERGDEIFVLDYKTIDSSSYGGVKENHISSRGVWKNLQLPLYLAAAEKMFPNKKIRCGYFLAPKDVSATEIQEWENISDFKDDALKKALEVIEKIRACEFGPVGVSKYETFESIFGMSKQTLKESVIFSK